MCALDIQETDCVPIGETSIDQKVIDGFRKGYGDVVDFAFGEGLSLVGTLTAFEKVETLSDGCYVDEWGCVYKVGHGCTPHPIRGPIATKDDMGGYEFPDPDAPHRLGVLPGLVEKARGELAINFHSRVAFMWSVYLMGMDNLFITMAVDPGFAHELFQRVADINIRIIRRAVRAGADTVSLGDDYCANKGPMMSPKMFREFLLPHLKRAVDVIHEEGAKCIKHCDGNLWPILDDMVDTGIDAINPLEPVACMDVSEVKRKYGDRLCIMGNIDCGELLCHGSETDVEESVKACIESGGWGGGLIVSSSNSIHHGVKPENYSAMIKAVHRHGRYPLARPKYLS